MYRREILILLQTDAEVSLDFLIDSIGLTGRSIRTIIKNLRDEGNRNGFKINAVRGIGYQLEIVSKAKFESYFHGLSTDSYLSKKQSRIPLILYYLLQQNSYLPLQTLADYLGVTRNTIIGDLDSINEHLQEYNLRLISKSHYGIKLQGSEIALRKAFTKYVISSKEYTIGLQTYFEYISELNLSDLRLFLLHLFQTYQFTISNIAFSSIVDHVKVLLYRAANHNYISSVIINNTNIDASYVDLTKELVAWLSSHYEVEIPDEEINYLVTQVAGKSSAANIDYESKYSLERRIKHSLAKIDQEFFTDFAADSVLIHSLLLHLYPLLTRIAYRVELRNPLVDEVSSSYANVFLVAVRFIQEFFETDEQRDVSRDEIGYLALHFAGYLDRKKQKIIDSYKRILIVSEVGR